MSTQTVRITDHPSKVEADRTVRIWKLEPNYVPGSGRSFQEGSTWTAEAQFYVVATAARPSARPALPRSASAIPEAARHIRPTLGPAALASVAVTPVHPKIDPALQAPLAAQGFARVIAVLAPTTTASLSTAAARNLLMTPAAVAESRLELAASRRPAARRARSAKASAASASAVRIFPRLGVALGYVDHEHLRAAASDPGLQAVYAAPPISLIRPVASAAARATGKVTWGIDRINVPKLWKLGLTGKGVPVAHLDTGVDGRHPAIKPALARGRFAHFDLAGNLVPNAPAVDTETHGTHTAGTLCGGLVKKLAIGVAPGANLFSAAVIEGGDVLMRILAGLEWALEHNTRVLSMSLGIRGYTPFFLDVTRALRRNNCLPVIAIGNDFAGTTRSPGNYAEALSVGACDRHDRVPGFSSSGRFQNPPHDEPNIVAPGVDVISAAPGGKVYEDSGTSMATPHVAGVAALLMQAAPTATIDEIENAIVSTAKRLSGVPAHRQGFGIIDAAAALQAL